MAKCIAAWQGGINFKMQYAASIRGNLFKRFFEKNRFGAGWSSWQFVEKLDVDNLPETIQAGFGAAFRPNPYRCVGWQKWRLPE